MRFRAPLLNAEHRERSFFGPYFPDPSRPMGRRARVAIIAVIGVALSACAAAPSTPTRRPLARIETVDGIARVVLVPKALERIGIQTAPPQTIVVGGRQRTAIPYGALIYDTKGEAFAYTNPAPLTYVRRSVRVQAVQGDRVVLADGLSAGDAVVIVGASQLLGIELGVGS